jgi:hypothetical protein
MKRRKTKKVKMVRILGETVRKGGVRYRFLLAERRNFLRRQRDPNSSYYGVPISQLLKSNRRRVRRNEALPGPYYVWMTDKFMSGWGQAQGRLNKYVVRCDTLEQAECIYKNAQMRDEMKNINYGRKLPYFSESKYKVTMKTWDQLGYVWKTGCKWQNEDDYYADPRRMSPNRRRGLRRNPIQTMGVYGGRDGFEITDFKRGDRIQMHPGTDLWMRGARYGWVLGVGKKNLNVKLDYLKREIAVSPRNIGEIVSRQEIL